MYKHFGSPDENGNFGVLSGKVDGIFEQIIGSSKELEIRCNNKVEQLKKDDGFIDDIIGKYGPKLGDVKIDNNMVKAARDYVAPNVKFKPWGAVKVANNLNKGLGAVSLILEAWNLWKSYKAEQKLNEIKSQLKEYLGEYFNALNAFIRDDNKYFALYPSFLELVRTLKQREQELQVCKTELTKLRKYQERVQRILESDIVDVEFE